jgi:hypothetical protein
MSMVPGASCGLGVDAMHLGARQALNLGVQDEVEGDLRIGAIEPVLAELRGIRVAMHLGDQAVTGREGEVVVQIFITVDVDLGRQLPVARRRDEERRLRPLREMSAVLTPINFSRVGNSSMIGPQQSA